MFHSRDLLNLALSRPVFRRCPTRNGNQQSFIRPKGSRKTYLTAQDMDDTYFNDDELRKAVAVKKERALEAENASIRLKIELLQTKLDAALKYAQVLMGQVDREKFKANCILDAWESVSDMSFAVEARYGIGLTVEQFNSIVNTMSGSFDEERCRWVHRTIPGTG